MTTHKLTEQYLARVEGFRHAHPPAHRFLTRLQEEGPGHGLWLSTATNAHLYKRNGFLVYIKLNNPTLRAPTLVLAPEYNQQISAAATDQSPLLFPKAIEKLVMDQHGFREKWAVKLSKGAYELRPSAPDGFFGDLFGLLEGVVIEE